VPSPAEKHERGELELATGPPELFVELQKLTGEGHREPPTEGSDILVVVLVELLAGMKSREPFG
jgi:hypothetical protein